MNEQKFRELARKADFALWEDEGWKPEGAIIDWGPNYDLEIQKFAESIIRECIEQIHGADVGDLKAKSYYLDRVVEHIENYFGIEQ